VGFERLVREAVVEAGYPLRVVVWCLISAAASLRRGATTSRVCRCRPAASISTVTSISTSPSSSTIDAKAALHGEFKARLRAVVYADTHEQAY